jgi:hypothetical protein
MAALSIRGSVLAAAPRASAVESASVFSEQPRTKSAVPRAEQAPLRPERNRGCEGVGMALPPMGKKVAEPLWGGLQRKRLTASRHKYRKPTSAGSMGSISCARVSGEMSPLPHCRDSASGAVPVVMKAPIKRRVGPSPRIVRASLSFRPGFHLF